mmetsp:Transcript_61135/g.145659  ORF Transcript_61135/g.145659 Transcript_61135/m.145659 type:complete len:221 (-) Transcript_61135:225-887(-)
MSSPLSLCFSTMPATLGSHRALASTSQDLGFKASRKSPASSGLGSLNSLSYILTVTGVDRVLCAQWTTATFFGGLFPRESGSYEHRSSWISPSGPRTTSSHLMTYPYRSLTCLPGAKRLKPGSGSSWKSSMSRRRSRPKCICRGMASESPPGTSISSSSCPSGQFVMVTGSGRSTHSNFSDTCSWSTSRTQFSRRVYSITLVGTLVTPISSQSFRSAAGG